MQAGYIRILDSSLKLDALVETLRRAGCSWTYTDIGITERGLWPEFSSAIDQLERGDILVIKDLGQFGATTAEIREALGRCRDHGIIVRSLDDDAFMWPHGDKRHAAILALLSARSRAEGRGTVRRGRPPKRPEQRRDPRLKLSSEVQVRLEDGRVLPGRLRDLSRGGACVTLLPGYRATEGRPVLLTSSVLGGDRAARLVTARARRLHFQFELRLARLPEA
jgi:DNA invertase Pin-like site-specific DNA recombinase